MGGNRFAWRGRSKAQVAGGASVPTDQPVEAPKVRRSLIPVRGAAPTAASACWAPMSSLYFFPDGRVLTCCVNTEYVLGVIGDGATLTSLWNGRKMDKLRRSLAARDFSHGCERCDPAAWPGGEDFSHARQFDDFQGAVPGDYPQRMDFVLSNTCNLQCIMCSGELSSSIRAQREGLPPLPKVYDDAFFEEIREFLPHLKVSFFLGGEPFLARESRRIWDLMIELGVDIPVWVVTNGTQWNDKVEHYLKNLRMGLSVSIDGLTPETTASIRVGADRDEVKENVARYRAILEPKGGNVVMNYCLMRQNWHEFFGFLRECDQLDLEGRVVTVTDPSRFSLYRHPDPDYFGNVVDQMEQEAARSAPLQRNRDVWDTELARLKVEVQKQRRSNEERGPVDAARADSI